MSSQVLAYIAPEISRWHWLGLSAAVVLFATWGDLTESLLKRTLGVKDSGNILPGHGGMLDRFDSVLMAIPATYIYRVVYSKLNVNVTMRDVAFDNASEYLITS